MRPKAVTITTWIMAVLNLMGYALLFETEGGQTTVLWFALITLMILCGYIVLWFFWQGKNWARILVFLSCFLCFYNLSSLRGPANVGVKIMVIGEAAVAAFLVYWLNTSEAKAFFTRKCIT